MTSNLVSSCRLVALSLLPQIEDLKNETSYSSHDGPFSDTLSNFRSMFSRTMGQGEDKPRAKYTAWAGEGSFIGLFLPRSARCRWKRTAPPQDFVSIHPRNVRPLLRGLNFGVALVSDDSRNPVHTQFVKNVNEIRARETTSELATTTRDSFNPKESRSIFSPEG